MTAVTDAGLVHLEGLTDLTFLYLSGTRVTDAGLVHLKGLSKLSGVTLPRLRVTGAGAKDLEQALPKLTIYK